MRFFWKLLALVAGLAVSVLVVSSSTLVLTATGLLIDGVGREAMRLAEDASNVLNTELVATVLVEPGDTAEWSLLVDEVADIQSEQGPSVNERCHELGECGQLEAFITAGKPVLNTEYLSDYVSDTGARDAVCSQARGRDFHTLVLPEDLDDSFRFSCDDSSTD
jgi:hypothetical protein